MNPVTGCPKKELVTEKYSDLKPERIDWLWPNKIPAWGITLLVGDPGSGKSTLSLYVAAQVSTGRPFPNCKEPTKPGTSIIITAEDSHPATVLPRLMATDANLGKIERTVCIKTTQVRADGSEASAEESLGADLMERLDLLEEKIKGISDFRLLIIDTIPSYMGDKNLNGIVDVRAFMDRLTALAYKYRFSILAISHFNKNQGVPAQYRIVGSIGQTGAARAVWGIVKDVNDPARRIVASGKLNLTGDTSGVSFRFDKREISIDGKPEYISRCNFEPGTVKETLDDLLVADTGGKGSPLKNEAATWLQEYLVDGKEHDALEIIEAAEQSGIKEKTLRRAHQLAGVKAIGIRDNGGKITGWKWALLS